MDTHLRDIKRVTGDIDTTKERKQPNQTIDTFSVFAAVKITFRERFGFDYLEQNDGFCMMVFHKNNLL